MRTTEPVSILLDVAKLETGMAQDLELTGCQRITSVTNDVVGFSMDDAGDM